MNLAQSQLQAARAAHAADYAPVDLGFAQDKFQQAQSAMAERKYADASVLAAEAQADAELATAKGRLGAARAEIQQKVDENNLLRRPGDSTSNAMAAPAPATDDYASPPMASSPAMPAPAESAQAAADGLGSQPAAPAPPAPPSVGGFQTVPSAASGDLPAQAQSVPPPPGGIPAGDAGQGQGAQP